MIDVRKLAVGDKLRHRSDGVIATVTGINLAGDPERDTFTVEVDNPVLGYAYCSINQWDLVPVQPAPIEPGIYKICCHPRSCLRCQSMGVACGSHRVGDRGHELCTGSETLLCAADAEEGN